MMLLWSLPPHWTLTQGRVVQKVVEEDPWLGMGYSATRIFCNYRGHFVDQEVTYAERISLANSPPLVFLVRYCLLNNNLLNLIKRVP